MSTRQPSVLRHRLRIVTLAAVLLAFDVALVGAVYVLAHVAIWLLPLASLQLHAIVWPPALGLVPLWPFVLVGTPITLALQSVFGYRLTLRDITSGDIGPDKSLKNVVLADRSDDDNEDDALEVTAPPADHCVRERVARLAQTADTTPPEVRVVHSATPNSYVASRPGERTLFVTAGLLDALDGEELDAVLAHELAHLKNGDAFVMTAAAFLPTVTEQFLERYVRALRRSAILNWVWDLDTEETIGIPQIELPMLLLATIAFPIVGSLYVASTTCYRLLSRIREYAADAGGVAISGSPAALASALETLTADLRPETDLRIAETGVRELCVLPYAIDERDEAIPDDRIGRLQERWGQVCDRVLPGSHPEPNERIAALREQQHRLER